MKVNKYSLFVDLVCALLITTLVQTILPFNINRIIGFGLFFISFFLLLDKKNKKHFKILFLSGISVLFSFFMTSNISINLSNSIYWLIAIWLIFISKDTLFQKKMLIAFKKEKKKIHATIIISDIILGISFLDPQSYKITYSERYFVGFTVHQHTLASAACLVMCLILADLCTNNESRNKFSIKYFILIFLPIVTVLEASARIFIVPAIIIVAYMYVYKIEKVSLKLVVLPIAMIIMGVLFINSNIFERMINISTANSDAYTSGRTVFWLADIRAFMQSGIINKIFGHGFEYVQKINLKVTNMAIGAHNDYITLLLGVGILGCLIYILVLIREVKYIFKLKSFIKEVMLLFFWVIPSFINGFYGYQLLLYSYLFFKLVILKDSDYKKDYFNVNININNRM